MGNAQYLIRTAVEECGERLPMLLNADGTAHYYGNLYSLSLRTKNRASHTLEIALRAIHILYQCLSNDGIHLESRLESGNFLTRTELEQLNRACRLPLKEISTLAVARDTAKTNVVRFELYRKKSVPAGKVEEVSKKTVVLRQTYIKDHLLWLLEWFAHHNGGRSESLDWAKAMTQRVFSVISPAGARKNIEIRQGLSQESQQELLRLVAHTSPDNPWDNIFCRVRNELLINILFYLGIRRGELLALRVSDINFAKNKILIARRPDDPEDSRRYQPLVKTLSRSLPLESVLVEHLYEYIHEYRREKQNAKRHPFLFVSSTGHPLSLSGFLHVCLAIRAASPTLLSNFSAHLLRHTWNDRFSKIMKDNGVPPAREQQLRCFLMGWAPHSKMGQNYTKRYVREEAQRVSLQIQKEAVSLRRDND